MNDVILRITPEIEPSLRARVSSYPVLRHLARKVIHWQPVWFPYMCGSYAGIVSLEIEGIKMRYGLGEADPIGDYLYWCGARSWDQAVIGVFTELSRQAQGVIFDVGANCGLFTTLAAMAHSKNRVVAWEPLPGVQERVIFNAHLNGVEDRVELRRAAVGATSGQAMFHLHRDPTMSGFSMNEETQASFPVEVETLDNISSGPVKLVKIDVEGHEISVLRGMEDTLDRDRPKVLLECWDAALWTPIGELFQRHGYVTRSINPSNYLAVHPSEV